MTRDYPQPLVSVDVVPIRYNYDTAAVEVILGRRIFEPALGELALPGVLVGHEHIDDAAARALRVKVGMPADLVPVTRSVGVFDGDLRDERGPTISIAQLALFPPVRDGSSTAYEHDPERHAPVGPSVRGLPFDHDKIISEAARALLLLLFADREVTEALLPHPFTTVAAQQVVDSLAERAATLEGVSAIPAPQLRPRTLERTEWLEQAPAPSQPRGRLGRGRPAAEWRWSKQP